MSTTLDELLHPQSPVWIAERAAEEVLESGTPGDLDTLLQSLRTWRGADHWAQERRGLLRRAASDLAVRLGVTRRWDLGQEGPLPAAVLDSAIALGADHRERSGHLLQVERQGELPHLHRLIRALREEWRHVEEDEVFERKVIGQAVRELASELVGGPQVFTGAPTGCAARWPNGRQGTITGPYANLYEFHQEWPIDGMGCGREQVSLRDGEDWVPGLQWLESQGAIVICTRCGAVLDEDCEAWCPRRGRRRG